MPKWPTSYYGKAKLASEKIISHSAINNESVIQILRFPNVIGPNLTHGLIFDLISKLKENSANLTILGDGYQRKPFMHVDDLVNIIFEIWMNGQQIVENVSPEDTISVREIVELTCEFLGVKPQIIYGEEEFGWIGDVPKYSYEKNTNHFVLRNEIRNSTQSVTDTLQYLVG